MGVLPVSKKEGKQKGKNGIGPRMKNGRANLKPNEAFTNGGFSVTCHLHTTDPFIRGWRENAPFFITNIKAAPSPGPNRKPGIRIIDIS